MRKFATVLLFCAVATLVLSAQTKPLGLVSTAWPPFTDAAGRPRFALDLVEAALGKFGMSATTTIVSAERFTPSLLTGSFDGSAAAWKDPQRERVLLYSRAYLENRLVLVGRKGSDVSAKQLADLKGKKIAIVEGYAYGDSVYRAGPTFVPSRSEEDSLSRLLNGSVDYTLMDDLVVQYLISDFPKESAAKLEIGIIPLATRTLHLAVRRSRSDAESIVSRFNAQLKGMIADGTYHRLLHVDWIRADLNDDGKPVNVPASDHPGASEPQHVYSLFATTPSDLASQPTTKPGFYFGGNIYSDWASVPDSYKTPANEQPDARRSTASIFTFRF